MGEMPDDNESREYKRSVELNNFDPRQKLQRTMTGEHLSSFMHKVSNSNHCAIFLKSVEEMTVPVAQRLTVIGIANKIIISNSMMSNEKVNTFLKRLFFNKKVISLW